MSLTVDQYNCCLNQNSLPICASLPEQPNQITTPACKNAMVRHCQLSANITTPMCRTFIDNLVRNAPPLADMDQQVVAFCKTNREKTDAFYEQCRCVNVANTCLGQKILRYKAGNPGCYYPPCKENDVFQTSSLFARSCTSITCAIGNITIKGGDKATIVAPPGMINQNCGNTTLQPPRSADKYTYVTQSSSKCAGIPLADTAATASFAQDTAQTACKSMCDGRNDCNAFQLHCDPEAKTCACQLFRTNGVGVPLIDSCSTSAMGSMSQSEFDKQCSGSKAVAKDVKEWTCSHHRNPPAGNATGGLNMDSVTGCDGSTPAIPGSGMDCAKCALDNKSADAYDWTSKPKACEPTPKGCYSWWNIESHKADYEGIINKCDSMNDFPKLGSNKDPPPGFKAKSGSEPCKCQGNGLGINSCGELCCANSPFTSTDPDSEHYFEKGGTKTSANLCWEKE